MENELPVQYYTMYEKIEKKIRDLSYVISFDEIQKNVYSLYIGELELQIFTLMESIVKTEAKQIPKYKQLDLSRLKYEDVIKKIADDRNKSVKIAVIFEPYNLDKKFYDDILIKKDNRIKSIVNGEPEFEGEKKNYKYNNAYQNLRHNFLDSLKVVGTIEYLFEALAVDFYLLDLYSSSIFSKYEEGESGNKFVLVPGKTTLRRKLDD